MGFGKLKTKLDRYKWWIAGGSAAAGVAYYQMRPEAAPEGWSWGKTALVGAAAIAIGIPVLATGVGAAAIMAGVPFIL